MSPRKRSKQIQNGVVVIDVDPHRDDGAEEEGTTPTTRSSATASSFDEPFNLRQKKRRRTTDGSVVTTNCDLSSPSNETSGRSSFPDQPTTRASSLRRHHHDGGNNGLVELTQQQIQDYRQTKPTPEGGYVEMEPRFVDVLGSRLRSWQRHPGTQYYRDLMLKGLPHLLKLRRQAEVAASAATEAITNDASHSQLQDNHDSTTSISSIRDTAKGGGDRDNDPSTRVANLYRMQIRNLAESVVDICRDERGGVFLKDTPLRESSSGGKKTSDDEVGNGETTRRKNGSKGKNVNKSHHSNTNGIRESNKSETTGPCRWLILTREQAIQKCMQAIRNEIIKSVHKVEGTDRHVSAVMLLSGKTNKTNTQKRSKSTSRKRRNAVSGRSPRDETGSHKKRGPILVSYEPSLPAVGLEQRYLLSYRRDLLKHVCNKTSFDLFKKSVVKSTSEGASSIHSRSRDDNFARNGEPIRTASTPSSHSDFIQLLLWTPLKKDESEQERLIRLQMRQRLLAASTAGIDPIAFCQSLLVKTWKGTMESSNIDPRKIEQQKECFKQQMMAKGNGAVTSEVAPPPAMKQKNQRSVLMNGDEKQIAMLASTTSSSSNPFGLLSNGGSSILATAAALAAASGNGTSMAISPAPTAPGAPFAVKYYQAEPNPLAISKRGTGDETKMAAKTTPPPETANITILYDAYGKNGSNIKSSSKSNSSGGGGGLVRFTERQAELRRQLQASSASTPSAASSTSSTDSPSLHQHATAMKQKQNLTMPVPDPLAGITLSPSSVPEQHQHQQAAIILECNKEKELPSASAMQSPELTSHDSDAGGCLGHVKTNVAHNVITKPVVKENVEEENPGIHIVFEDPSFRVEQHQQQKKRTSSKSQAGVGSVESEGATALKSSPNQKTFQDRPEQEQALSIKYREQVEVKEEVVPSSGVKSEAVGAAAAGESSSPEKDTSNKIAIGESDDALLLSSSRQRTDGESNSGTSTISPLTQRRTELLVTTSSMQLRTTSPSSYSPSQSQTSKKHETTNIEIVNHGRSSSPSPSHSSEIESTYDGPIDL